MSVFDCYVGVKKSESSRIKREPFVASSSRSEARYVSWMLSHLMNFGLPCTCHAPTMYLPMTWHSQGTKHLDPVIILFPYHKPASLQLRQSILCAATCSCPYWAGYGSALIFRGVRIGYHCEKSDCSLVTGTSHLVYGLVPAHSSQGLYKCQHHHFLFLLQRTA